MNYGANSYTAKPTVQDIMWEVFEYGNRQQAFVKEEFHGEARDKARAFLHEQDQKIRTMLEALGSHDGPNVPTWQMCSDAADGPECKGVHFLRHEAAKGGEVCVTAMHKGAFYEIRFKVPPFATGTPQEDK